MAAASTMARRLASQGMALFEASDYAAAQRALAKAMALEPGRRGGLLLGQAACFVSLGEPLKALAALEHYCHENFGVGISQAEALRKEALRQAGAAGLLNPPAAPGLHWKRAAPALRAAVGRGMNIYAELEYGTVRDGMREIGFVDLAPGDPMVERLKRDGLPFRRLRRIKKYAGFSHHHTEAAEGDSDAWEHSVIGRKTEYLDEVEALFKNGLDDAGHGRLGILLGFPPCCVKFFERVWLGERAWDPIFEAGINTRGKKESRVPGGRQVTVVGHPYCNMMLRYTGLRVTSWMPCSLSCPETIKRAQSWVDLGRRLDAPGVESLLEILSMPLVWRCVGGQARVETDAFYVSAASYCPPDIKVLKWSTAAAR